MRDGGNNAWSETCHEDNKYGEGEIHNVVSLSEYMEVILYDILMEANDAVSCYP